MHLVFDIRFLHPVKVQFDFSALPIEELQQFLQPNRDLPFKVQSYQFNFECWHFHDFKDIMFSFACKRPLEAPELKAIRFYIYNEAFEYKKKAIDEQRQVDYIGPNLVAWSKLDYQLNINMGNADPKIIGQMLEEINDINAAQAIKSVWLL